MPIVLPSGNTAAYLAAINAAAVYVADPLHAGAASVRGLRRLPRGTGTIVWLAWTRQLEDARRIVVPDTVWQQCGDGVQRCRSTPELVTLIEQRAHELSVPLTPHERATERAAVLAQRVDAILTSFRANGQLKAFNVSYRRHRLSMNGHAPPYAAVLSDLRAEVIRVLVEQATHRGKIDTAVLLSQRLHRRFPWYVWYG